MSFATAQLDFDDPFAVSRPDRNTDESRWQTLGMVDHVVVFVVHTWPDPEPEAEETVGRIISARKATARERRAYEEGEF